VYGGGGAGGVMKHRAGTGGRTMLSTESSLKPSAANCSATAAPAGSGAATTQDERSILAKLRKAGRDHVARLPYSYRMSRPPGRVPLI